MANYNTLTDGELILLLKEDNDAAFREIYLRYDKLLYLYAYKKLRNKEEAKDVVQDVFTWLLNHRKEIHFTVGLSAYLYKAVLHKIFDIFKHQGIIKKYAESGEHYIEVKSTETDYLIREKDIMALIEREIAAMPPKMREIYILKRKHFLSTKEIAQQLDISEHTVSTQLKRAMKHLRIKLGLVAYLLWILKI
ncbi:RNA polymerase sigma-70 factor (ECF subfamily) [Pedobacter cryoconitis]|uniref:RNA polymerase sigma-70 factor (ECF subfamily) n=1 Tax=Pedobacter cryoconitis TaxID=188932 RepID=A0A7W8ZRQ6_9SPHI|nr:RNA polymerase sigma-70 factor [Pedobacter cryoconitis]MBB5638627.1 RNA polymerase sigma-70 factor (ECF subfamily) [Pedobacter cryoconitis]MBB6274358.1 RNA polymerase sigma-70 factor (ECF subfamily) [Pedobacter cryoconitis]